MIADRLKAFAEALRAVVEDEIQPYSVAMGINVYDHHGNLTEDPDQVTTVSCLLYEEHEIDGQPVRIKIELGLNHIPVGHA